MKKAEKQAYVRRRAYELAESGTCTDYVTIEILLDREGYPEARDWLDDEYLRESLNKICDRCYQH